MMKLLSHQCMGWVVFISLCVLISFVGVVSSQEASEDGVAAPAWEKKVFYTDDVSGFVAGNLTEAVTGRYISYASRFCFCE